MNNTLWLDFETTSKSDLKVNGLQRYVEHLTTQVLCLGYAFNDEDAFVWFPEDGAFPERIIEAVKGGCIMVAQNARFDRLIWEYILSNDYDLVVPKLTQWRCSAARAMAHGLPASLEDIGRALELPVQKQKEGLRLINEYSKNGRQPWKDDDQDLMAEYCATDVEVMRSFCSVLHELPANEWHEYHIVEQINDSGVPLDISFAEAAVDYANDVKADVNGQIIQLTAGAIRSAKARKTRDEWLLPLLTKDEYKLLHTLDKKTGTLKRSFDKKARAKLLLSPDLDRKARRFTQLVEDAGGSTIAKYTTMANKHVDGVIHGAMTWNGAGQTGRLSSKDLQVNNMRRDVMDNAEELIEDVIEGYEIDEPADTLGRLARAAITHTKGVDFSDYAQIEARILPWLIKSKAGDKALNVFREGRDLYKVNAMMMFGINSEDAVEDDTRQAAKVTSLACQFGGAQGAVAAMAENYGMRYTEEQRRDIVERWRQANPHVVKFWYEVSDAAKNAVRNPQIPYSVGRLVYFYDGADWLMCKLPCGRLIKYYQPRFEHCPLPWDEDAIQLTALWGSGKPKVEEKWPRRALSHLVLVENAVQGVGASLMRGAIVRVHEAGIRIILSCHDELVTIGGQPKKLQALMKQEPTWAKGLPIDADIKSRKRYGK